MKKVLFAAICAATVAGCASVSEVIPAGKDTYLVGANVRGGMTSDAEVTGMSVKRANEFCAAQGKQVEVISSTNSGTQGWTPQNSQVMFRCIPK